MQESRKRYAELGLPRSIKKAFDKEYCFKAWGTQVDSNSGRVGTPLQKLRQVEELTLRLISQKHVSKKALQKLLGLYVHPFMHRRECMSIFHHTYLFIDNLPEGVYVKSPNIFVMSFLRPFCCFPLRQPTLDSPCLHASPLQMPV